MRKQSFPFWFVLFSLLFYASCRKSDFENTSSEKPISIDRFFNVSESADTRLKAIAQSIKAQETDHPFLKEFTKRAGWPVWDKSKIIGPHNFSNGRTSNGDSSTLVYIPFVIDSAITVNAVLAVNMEATDTSWRMLYASNYQAFGFDTTTSNDWNARNVFQFFALFDHDIFGHTKFLLKDERLFNSPQDSSIITLKSRNGVAVNGRTNRTESYVIEECGTWEVCESAPAYARTNSINNDCFYIDICTTYYYDDGGGGGGSGGGNGWTGDGGGGGSGGSGDWGTSDPCPTQPIQRLSDVYPCSPGWVPIQTDANGYYYDRIALLQAILDQDPYFLIPCDYLSQFQTIGSFQAPQPVRDRLNNVNAAYENWLIQNSQPPSPEPLYNILMLDNAAGTVVNCDYFPIHITVLPTINGVQLTPQQVFEHFRNNINTVINTSIAEFEPYVAFGVNDEILWNSPNPFTSLVHINMIDDGTVIISDYQLSTNISRMKASTLRSPLDMTHPVSGTREWGIRPDPNGGFFFYTTAVDRLTEKFTEIVDNIITTFGGASGLSQGDELWKSLQDKMIAFINNNGGQAERYSNQYVAARPDYSAVRDFLLGIIDLQTMRQRIGC